MIKSTQVDFFVAIVKKGVMWYDKSRKDIFERSELIQNNLNKFDKDMQKEKDNIRNY